MARLNRNWLRSNHVNNHIKQANGLKDMNTQAFHDALMGVTTDLLVASMDHN